jgi:hypothetical protein
MLPAFQHFHGLDAEPCGEQSVEGGRRSTALNVRESWRGFKAGCFRAV